jgi:hypothetical protein
MQLRIKEELLVVSFLEPTSIPKINIYISTDIVKGKYTTAYVSKTKELKQTLKLQISKLKLKLYISSYFLNSRLSKFVFVCIL